MIHHTSCPICSSSNIKEVLRVKDHTVSGEVFPIFMCGDCTARFTQDVAEENEIGKYYQSASYISHSDTQEGIVNKLYHAVRKRTLESKRKIVEKYAARSGGHLLDIGAGTGAFVKTIRDAGWEVTGVEPDAAVRVTALAQNNVLLESTEALELFEENKFDAITMWHVLEHVHGLHAYCNTINRILNKNGVLIVAVPNYTSADADHYQEHWAAYDVPRHLYHFSPKSMHVLMKGHGFEVMEMLPMWFDSSYVSMLSEQYKTGKSNFVSALWQGMASNAKALGKKELCSSVIYICKKKY